ncbi:hypothetical protein [Entomospira culicis]|uniref:Uncharacterized protein n=1 Tax=Entomospira culicis TaxID=2719989 RepID=A0A968KWE8_9SPIO|nr:hypothetical protein [Entomospira culicis]NIZ18912.1 hypothetical protein [Entomospira culicis]NIZ69127.1 hypothetical protein [Entomospira culicis]WDI39341.1 hypothetical protein PVA47_02720 [Entomospira culicis]
MRKTKRGDFLINACDSSKDKVWVGWLKQWMQRFGMKQAPLCAVAECGKLATTGAHVRLMRRRHEFSLIYIVPMCTGCNNRTGVAGSPPPKMRARSGVLLMESNLKNTCRYRCKNSCKFKQKRQHWWQRLFGYPAKKG